MMVFFYLAVLFDGIFLAGLICLLLSGLIIGISLAQINRPRYLGFVIISTVSFIVCFLAIDLIQSHLFWQNSVNVISVSSFYLIVLSTTYQLKYLKNITFYRSIFALAIVGIFSAIPAAISCYYLDLSTYSGDFSKKTLLMFLPGILSIFPLWQLAFVWVMNSKRFNPVSQKTATGI